MNASQDPLPISQEAFASFLASPAAAAAAAPSPATSRPVLGGVGGNIGKGVAGPAPAMKKAVAVAAAAAATTSTTTTVSGSEKSVFGVPQKTYGALEPRRVRARTNTALGGGGGSVLRHG